MNTTPSWQAAKNGLPGDLTATNRANQVDQELGTHVAYPIYQGTQVLTPNGSAGGFSWINLGNTSDFDQPFVLSGTSVGRVTLPLLPVGDGADLLVTLYPDSGGNPDITNVLSSTMIPKEWINALAAPDGITDGAPLATSKSNTMYTTGGITQKPWVSANSTSGGNSIDSAATTSGNFIVSAGGADPSTSAAASVVTSTKHTGTGSVDLPIPQPSLPIGISQPASTTTSSLVLTAGGTTGTTLASATKNVYVASWDPTTGAMGSWSAQTPLPVALVPAEMVTWNDSFVYVIGGSNAANAQVDTVYSATITNGQIGPWVTCAPLLQGTDLCFAEVIGTWLVVAGGFINGGARLSSTYYSRIYPDGSLGGWQTAPSLPSAYTDAQNGWNLATTDRAMVLVGNPVLPANNVNVLTFDDVAGPADGWVSTTWPHTTNAQVGAFSNGDGSYDMIGLYPVNQYYEATTLTPVPMISVPLYATGLTNGGTYHVVLQQNKSESASSYLSYGINAAGLPTDARSSLRNANSWSTYSAGNSMPMSVYDTSVSNSVHHTWEDPSNTGSAYTSNRAARVTTTVYDELRRPIGYLEATTQPNDALNVNPTFTSGVTSWTAHNGTFVQSAAQTHGGFPFSGLLTPTGGFSIAYAESEKIPIGSSNAALGTERWIAPNGWFYSPGGYANFSLSVNWYNSAGGFISTSSSIVSLTAATWTNVAKLYQAPLTAASATLAPTEIATPAAGNTVFFSDVVMQLSPETVKPFATVSQITYDSVTAQANGVVIL